MLEHSNFRSKIVYIWSYLVPYFSDTVVEYLVNVITSPEFRPWEISDLTPRIKIDKALAKECPQIGEFVNRLYYLSLKFNEYLALIIFPSEV